MPSVNIQKAAQNKDVFKIRSYLIADILVDKSFSGIFKEDFEYCLKNGISEDEIYETHDNKTLSNEVSEENIFVIVEDGNANFDYRDVAGKMANKLRITMLSLNYKHQQAWNLLEKPWNGFSATPSFLKLYEYQNTNQNDLNKANQGFKSLNRRASLVAQQ